MFLQSLFHQDLMHGGIIQGFLIASGTRHRSHIVLLDCSLTCLLEFLDIVGVHHVWLITQGCKHLLLWLKIHGPHVYQGFIFEFTSKFCLKDLLSIWLLYLAKVLSTVSEITHNDRIFLDNPFNELRSCFLFLGLNSRFLLIHVI